MQRMLPSRTLLARGARLSKSFTPPSTTTSTRRIHSSVVRRAEDKSDPAFSPQSTRPEEHDQRASEATKNENDAAMNSTPKVNPANPEASKPRDPQEGGREGSSAEDGQGRGERDGQSGGGSPMKGGGVKSG